MSRSSEQLIQSADGSVGKIGRRQDDGTRGFNPDRKSGFTEGQTNEIRLCQYQGCRLGAAQQCAKQKAFGTLLAMAPSPAFYWAAEKSHIQLGDFSAALKKRKWRKVEGRGITKAKHCARWRKKVSPLRRAVLKSY